MLRLRSLIVLAVAAPALAACADDATPIGPVAAAPSLARSPSPEASLLIKMRDNCDPASFNAVLGPGTCVGDGTQTFASFIAELEATQTATAWRNKPVVFSAPVGTTLNVVNLGGEVHTLTHVAAFGGGIVKVLNDLSKLRPVAPECLQLAPSDFIPHGGRFSIPTGGTGPGVGTHLYMCCIHPWMQTTATLTPITGTN
jgi:hypothetical protein